MNNKLVVLVTGATRGIGKAVTEHYAKRGARVIGVYKARTLRAKKIERAYPTVTMHQVDLGNHHAVTKFVNELSKTIDHLDILINNAGIYTGGTTQTLKIPELQYNFMVNVVGKFVLTQQMLPLLRKGTAPKVINVSSRFGFVGNADPESIAYNISNSAIIMMSLAMQKELLPKGILVGCYIPTVTNTDRFKKAFSVAEQKEIRNSGMLATAQDTARKIVSYAGSLEDSDILVDKRVNTQHFNCMHLQTI